MPSTARLGIPSSASLAKHFVNFARFGLLLPQLLSGAREPLLDAITDTEQDTCRLFLKETPLDPFALHPFCSCSGTVASVTRLHKDCMGVLYNFAVDHAPDLKPKYEPSAPYLMSPTYTEAECALLFHGDSTVASKALAAQLRTFIDLRNVAKPNNRLALAHLTAQKTSELRLFLINRKDARPGSASQCAVRRHKSNGVRPDLALWGHSPKPTELWVDHTGCHDHSSTFALTDKTLTCLHEAELLANTCPLHWNPKPVPAMITKAREKLNRFAPMADAAAFFFCFFFLRWYLGRTREAEQSTIICLEKVSPPSNTRPHTLKHITHSKHGPDHVVFLGSF